MTLSRKATLNFVLWLTLGLVFGMPSGCAGMPSGSMIGATVSRAPTPEDGRLSSNRRYSAKRSAGSDWLIRTQAVSTPTASALWLWRIESQAVVSSKDEAWMTCSSTELLLKAVDINYRRGNARYVGSSFRLEERDFDDNALMRTFNLSMPHVFGASVARDQGWLIVSGTDSTRRVRENPGSLGPNPFGTTDVYFEAPKRLLIQILNLKTGEPLGPVVTLMDADGVLHDSGSQNGKVGGFRISLADDFPGVIVHGAPYEMWVFPRAELLFADRKPPEAPAPSTPGAATDTATPQPSDATPAPSDSPKKEP